MPNKELAGLDCNHLFCSECYQSYLQSRIKESESDHIKCIEPGCSFIVPDDMILNLVNNDKTKQRYRLIITKNFVAENRLMRWCVNPICENAIKIRNVDVTEIICRCRFHFCFTCGQDFHLPATCEQAQNFGKDNINIEEFATNV